MNEVCEELAAKTGESALHGIVDNSSVGAGHRGNKVRMQSLAGIEEASR